MNSLDSLEPWLQPYASWLLSLYPEAQLTSTRRSFSEQLRLYLRYVNGASPYPAAFPGTSLHEQGRAFDLVAPDAVLARLGEIWEQLGGRWGGRFHDPIHFEA